MAKHMIMLRDSVIQECIQFLEHCEGMCNLYYVSDIVNYNSCQSLFLIGIAYLYAEWTRVYSNSTAPAPADNKALK